MAMAMVIEQWRYIGQRAVGKSERIAARTESTRSRTVDGEGGLGLKLERDWFVSTVPGRAAPQREARLPSGSGDSGTATKAARAKVKAVGTERGGASDKAKKGTEAETT